MTETAMGIAPIVMAGLEHTLSNWKVDGNQGWDTLRDPA
jgi:hypothetical protein